MAPNVTAWSSSPSLPSNRSPTTRPSTSRNSDRSRGSMVLRQARRALLFYWTTADPAGESTLVFSHAVAMGELLVRHLTDRGCYSALLYGGLAIPRPSGVGRSVPGRRTAGAAPLAQGRCQGEKKPGHQRATGTVGAILLWKTKPPTGPIVTVVTGPRPCTASSPRAPSRTESPESSDYRSGLVGFGGGERGHPRSTTSNWKTWSASI